MIKSEIKNKEDSYILSYPRLKIFFHEETENIVVVLFRKFEKGTCLYNKNNPSNVGYYETFGESEFKEFDGSVILKNLKGD